ncbi:conserved hypothetical protein [Ricinus communis]|uniref:Uncharacterized protein n=1 Tax=Ricinus communis TaxID=3988 RepID=B9TGG9_RICCO|nr:conserved hypothetical protein [Ricinus communis]
MEAVEIFSYVAGILGLILAAAKIDALSQARRAKSNAKGAAAPIVPAQAPSAADGPVSAPRPLNIEGAERVKLKHPAFLKGFGIRPEFVTDVARYATSGTIDTFPVAVRTALHRLFTEGALKGTEVVGILFRNEPLPEGQAIYFAMVYPPRQDPYVAGFVDRASH